MIYYSFELGPSSPPPPNSPHVAKTRKGLKKTLVSTIEEEVSCKILYSMARFTSYRFPRLSLKKYDCSIKEMRY
jgi:hypothetical protein